MARVDIVRKHKLSFLGARQLAHSWMIDSEQQFDLQSEYTEGQSQDLIVFSRKGLSGVLKVTKTEFELELTLGFLFSAYQKKIIKKINENMDKQLS